MRRATILALLLVAVGLIQPLGLRGQSEALLVFGFLVLAAYTVGEVAVVIGLPRIIGYLATGMLCGPFAFDLVSGQATRDLAPVSRLAIALIAILAGAELQWSELRAHGAAILRIMTAELSLTFVLLVGLLVGIASWVPFLRDASLVQTFALAAVFAAMAIIHSPAVTMAVLSETGASGPVARTTLGIVLLSDVAVILVVSAALAVARSGVPSPGASSLSVGGVVWELAGAPLIGAALGGIMVLYLRVVRRELFLFAILVAVLGAEVARILHVDVLLALLVAGFVAENFSPHGADLRHAMERSAAPIFVVFFALAGAALDLRSVVALWPVVVPLVIVRSLGLWGGVRLGSRWAGLPATETQFVWHGLVSQAGVAIGLAAVVAEAYPHLGSEIRTLFLAVMTVNQLIGPVLFRRALVQAGEIGDGASAPAARVPA